MRKLLAILLALLLIACMVIPASAATPRLSVPSMPSVPKIKVQITLPESFWDNWLANNPIVWNK